MSDIGLTYFGKSGYAHENRELALGNTQRVFAKLLEVAQTMAGRNVRVSQTPGYLARGLDEWLNKRCKGCGNQERAGDNSLPIMPPEIISHDG